MLKIGSKVTCPESHRSFVVASVSLSVGQPGWCKDFYRRCGKAPSEKGSGRFWIREMLRVCVRKPASGMFRGTTGRTASETLKACALIGLHMIAEATSSSCSSISFDLGEMWNYGGPRNPFLKGDDISMPSGTIYPELGDMWKYSCPKRP